MLRPNATDDMVRPIASKTGPRGGDDDDDDDDRTALDDYHEATFQRSALHTDLQFNKLRLWVMFSVLSVLILGASTVLTWRTLSDEQTHQAYFREGSSVAILELARQVNIIKHHFNIEIEESPDIAAYAASGKGGDLASASDAYDRMGEYADLL